MAEYKGELSAGGTILGSLIGQAGPKGDTGKDGKTPIKGVDYFTNSEIETMIQEITEDVESKIEVQEQKRQSNEEKRIVNETDRTNSETSRQSAESIRDSEEKIRQSNENMRKIQEDKREESENRRTNVFTEMQEDISNAIKTIQDKKAEYDKNALDKTKAFNDNSVLKIEAFNNNATEKTNAFNKNTESQTKKYDDNAKNKLDEYNNNDLDKIKTYNDNTVVKINEYNRNAETKINEYNQNTESLTNRITELETENKVLKNQIPKGQAEGNSIHLTDSSNMEMDWKIKGGHRQGKREGYNLLDFNVAQDSRVTCNEDGSITINGQGGFHLLFSQIKLEANKTYKQKIELISGTIKNSSGVDMTNQSIMSFKTDLWTSKDAYVSYTPKENGLRNGAWLHHEAIFSNARIKFWGYEGTDDKPYEQYGAMPSPEYPSEIETVGSNVNILKNTATSQTINGVDFIVKDGIVIANGTATENINFVLSNKNNLKAGTYTLSGCPAGGLETTYHLAVALLGTRTYLIDKGSTHTAQLSNDLDDLTYRIYIAKGITLNNAIFKPKLEKGSKATPYSPYKMGSVETDVVNDNLFGKPLLNYAISGNSSDGFLVENNSNGVTYIAKLKNNLNYYIKKNNNVGNRFRIVLFSDYPVSTNHSKNVKELTTNVDLTEYGFNSDKYNYVAFTVNANSELNEDCLVKLEQNTKATSYIEHQSQKQIMPTQQEMLEGDYIEDVEHHEWGKKVLDGTETVVGYNTGNVNKTAAFQINLSDSLNTTYNQKQMLTNIFNFNSTWGSDNECYNNSDKNFIVRLNVERLTGGVTVNGFKAWLKQKYDEGNPVIVYYKLSEPINLELTAEQKAIRENKLHSYKNITNITVDNELATAEVKYYKDLTTMMNNLANASIGGN